MNTSLNTAIWGQYALSGLFHGLRSDESLMLAYQRGDAAAFETVYARHKNGLYGFLLHSGAPRDMVDELAQETWFSIIRAIANYRDTAKFKTYLFQVARNKLIDHWRSQKASPIEQGRANVEHGGNGRSEWSDDEQAALQLAATSRSEPDQQLSESQMRELVYQLPTEQRLSFLLQEQGFSRADIAAITQAGEETVKSRLRYAKRALQQALEGQR